jgi:hypothetical protein
MSRRQGSIFWALVLISVGTLFLLSNMNIVHNPWRLLGTYWPVLIIFWGLSKLFCYFHSQDDPVAAKRSLLSGGDIVLLLFLLMVGSLLSLAGRPDWRWHNIPGITIGGGEPPDSRDERDTYTYSEEASQGLTAQDTALAIVNAYGTVDVNVHDQQAIRVDLEKKVRADSEAKGKELAGQLKIRIERKGQGYSISTNRADLGEDLQNSVKTNLSIWIPRKMAVNLTNKYGDVAVTAVSGNHQITNEYGSLTVKNVEGNVSAENKYGEVDLFGVSGDCKVSNKYASSEIKDIGGKVEVEGGHGSILITKVKGAVQLVNRYGSVECNDLESSLKLDGDHVEVTGTNIGGDAQIATSYQDVSLSNVRGMVTLQEKHGDVEISLEQELLKPIKVDSEYGSVTIALPKSSRFQFDGFSKYGKLDSEFEEIPSADFGNEKRVSGSKGKSGTQITVTTSYRDINLNAS